MTRTTSSAIALAATALLASAANAGPGVIIAPISATVDANGIPGVGPLSNTFDQSGLSVGYTAGVTNFDAYIAANPTHDFPFNLEFFPNDNTNTLQVTYDLGSVKTISALALWNEDATGIGLLDLLTSLDGSTFTALASGLAPSDNILNAAYLADVFTFGDVTTRYVRFEASRCPQPSGGTYVGCAIGEVAFRGAAVPETASWAMMIAGFGLVGAAMRRRHLATA